MQHEAICSPSLSSVSVSSPRTPSMVGYEKSFMSTNIANAPCARLRLHTGSWKLPRCHCRCHPELIQRCACFAAAFRRGRVGLAASHMCAFQRFPALSITMSSGCSCGARWVAGPAGLGVNTRMGQQTLPKGAFHATTGSNAAPTLKQHLLSRL